jgi:carbon-monoxide dehydrogenase medium subunit
MSQTANSGYQMTNSHILVHDFAYCEPATADQALKILAEYGGKAHLLAGGTYLVIQMKQELKRPECVVNIGKIEGLDSVAASGNGANIGALARIYELSADPAIRKDFMALAEACAAFGSAQIQMMGTLGGNVANGSPASDTVPALLAFDAKLRIKALAGEREVPLASFLVGPGKTALGKEELITSIELPQHRAGCGSSFIKISRVAADLAKASIAVVVERDGDTVVDCRLAFGSVGPVVMRTPKAEALLRGRRFSAELALEAGAMASTEVTPIDDVRSTAWYRREVVKALTHDALMVAWQRAGSLEPNLNRPGAMPGVCPRTSGVARQTGPDQLATISLTVNGVRHRLHVSPNELLVNVLRERLELTGTKYGCGLGECGACTILMDGRPTLSCLQLAIASDGCDVRTVEGLEAPNGELDPLQDSFIELNAFQCGFCTPGMLMMTKALLRANGSPSEDEIRQHLRGNRCRCTGFAAIVRAVESVAVSG